MKKRIFAMFALGVLSSCRGAEAGDTELLSFSDDETSESLPSYEEAIPVSVLLAPAPTPVSLSSSGPTFFCEQNTSISKRADSSTVSGAVSLVKSVRDYLMPQPPVAPKSFDEISLGAKLQIAFTLKDSEMLEQLMRKPEAGFLLSTPDAHGLSPFSTLCLQDNNEECIKTVLKGQKSIVDHPLFNGLTTTLGLVIKTGRPITARLLLELGADPDKAKATDLVGELCVRLGKENPIVQEFTSILKEYRGQQQERAIEEVARMKGMAIRSASSRSLQS